MGDRLKHFVYTTKVHIAHYSNTLKLLNQHFLVTMDQVHWVLRVQLCFGEAQREFSEITLFTV